MSDAKTFTSRKFDWCDGVAIDPRLTRAAIFKVAYCIMQHVNEKTGVAILSDEVIREKTNISIPMVKRHRVALRDAGWLKWQTKKGANFYTLDYGPLDRATDLAMIRREMRKEAQDARRKRRTEVSPVTLPEDCEVSPVIPDKSDEVSPVSYLEVSPVTLPEVSPVSHIHLSNYTFTDTPSQEGLSNKEEVVVEGGGPEQEIATAASFQTTTESIVTEQPIPPPLSEPLAEMKLFDELGEGDPDRGCRIATAIGDARFTYLRRELMRGTLYRSAVRAAARGVRLEAA